MYKLTLKAERIIIGLMLSNGWKPKRGHWNPRLALKHYIKNYPYLINTHYHLAYLCYDLFFVFNLNWETNCFTA